MRQHALATSDVCFQQADSDRRSRIGAWGASYTRQCACCLCTLWWSVPGCTLISPAISSSLLIFSSYWYLSVSFMRSYLILQLQNVLSLASCLLILIDRFVYLANWLLDLTYMATYMPCYSQQNIDHRPSIQSTYWLVGCVAQW